MVHEVAGQPVVRHAVEGALAAGVSRVIAVVGHDADQVKAALGSDAEYVAQDEQLGTGHALMQAAPKLRGFEGDLLVFSGDSPFLSADVFRKLLRHHRKKRAAATILTAILAEPGPYGRIVRGLDGRVIRIVEKKDASQAEYSIPEVNSGTYVFDAAVVLPLLKELDTNNVQGEYYLTDVIEMLFVRRMVVETLVADDNYVVLGVNDRGELAQAMRIFRDRHIEKLMTGGVTFVDPSATYVDATVSIGQDTVVYPFTCLENGTVIGKHCRIGPNVRVSNSRIGDGVRLEFAVVEDSRLKKGSSVAPFSHLVEGRPAD